MIKRIFLILFFGIVIIRIGIAIFPKIIYTFSPNREIGLPLKISSSETIPNFQLISPPLVSFSQSPIHLILDSIKNANKDTGEINSICLGNFGVATVTKPDSDISLIMIYPSKQDRSKNILLNIPSATRFRNLIKPEQRKDILEKTKGLAYPKALCKMSLDYGPIGKVILFHSEDPMELVVNFYENMLKKGKWERAEIDDKTKMKVYRKEGITIMLDISEEKESHGTEIGFIILEEFK